MSKFTRSAGFLFAFAILSTIAPDADARPRLSETRKMSVKDRNSFFDRLQSYVTIEHFLKDGAHDGFKERLDEVEGEVAAFYGSASSNFSKSNGNGVRLGVVYENFMGSKFDWGGNISYVMGPEATAGLDYAIYSHDIKIDSSFYQIMFEGSRRYQVTDNTTAKLGIGFGAGQGREDYRETIRVNTTGATFNYSDTDDWWNYSWDVQAAFGWNIGHRFVLESGLRYSQFPKRKKSSSEWEFDWKPASFFLSLYF